MASIIFSAVQMMGSGISVFGQYQQGQGQRTAYDYNASVAMQKTRQEQHASETKYSRLRGEQRALFSKAGVDMTSGSPLLVLANTMMQEEEEAQRIRFSGESEAQMNKWAGKNAAWAGTVGGMSTFLTGLGKVGIDYMKRESK